MDQLKERTQAYLDNEKESSKRDAARFIGNLDIVLKKRKFVAVEDHKEPGINLTLMFMTVEDLIGPVLIHLGPMELFNFYRVCRYTREVVVKLFPCLMKRLLDNNTLNNDKKLSVELRDRLEEIHTSSLSVCILKPMYTYSLTEKLFELYYRFWVIYRPYSRTTWRRTNPWDTYNKYHFYFLSHRPSGTYAPFENLDLFVYDHNDAVCASVDKRITTNTHGLYIQKSDLCNYFSYDDYMALGLRPLDHHTYGGMTRFICDTLFMHEGKLIPYNKSDFVIIRGNSKIHDHMFIDYYEKRLAIHDVPFRHHSYGPCMLDVAFLSMVTHIDELVK